MGGVVALTLKERREAGFTLIELMIVLFIIGLLVALVAPRLLSRVGKAKQKTAQAQIHLLSTALDLFNLDVGRYPNTEEGLKALWEKPENLPSWGGPYLDKSVPNDPWGRPYVYKCPGDHGPYDLYSLGADGAEGGEGENQDITNWSSSR
jgi:general secretion pathway protein G